MCSAAAHKLARLVYSMIKHGAEYVDQGEAFYEQEHKERIIKNLKRRAKEMGLSLVSEDGATTVTV
mgnify:FL=1